MSSRWRRRLLRFGSPLAIVVTLTACGPHRSTTIGLRATVLDLQFARPDLAVPVPPTVIVRLLPAPPAALQHILNPGTPVPPPPPPPPLPVGCPPPSAPARPGTPLAQGTLGSPKPGYYSFATVGQGTVQGRTSSTSAKLPPGTKVVVSASTKVAPGQTIALEGGAPASGKETQYTVTTLLSPTVRQVDTLAVSATSLNLVKRQLTDGARTFDVTPSPQVRLMVFGPVGTTWSSRGTDSATGTTVDYAGSIDAVTQVKACGIVTKAYVVSYQSTVTNTAGSEVVRDGTDKAHPSTLTIAPQLGGLVLATTVHSQDLRFYPDLRGYVGTNLDYTSTITDVQPVTS